MNYEERVDFIWSGKAKEFFENLEFMKGDLSPKEELAYRKALFGNEISYEVADDGTIIVKIPPFFDEGLQNIANNALGKYEGSIGHEIDPYNNMLNAIANAQSSSNLLVEYAKTFVGKLPYEQYVDDLSKAADCTYFVKGIYDAFDIQLPFKNTQGLDKEAKIMFENEDENLIISPWYDAENEKYVEFEGTVEEAEKAIEDFCKELKPGDIIAFNLGSGNDKFFGQGDHVVMYAGNGMIVQEHEEGRDAEYHHISELIINRAGNNPTGVDYSGNYDWQLRMPVYAIRCLTEEEQARFTVQGDA